MKPTYDTAVRDQVRQRMSPPNRESVAEIARSTGITTQTLYNWRSQWQKQGQLVPATTKPPEQWSALDKLAAVIQAAGLSGPDLGAFCRERGLYPKQLARWRQAAEDANGPSAPSMADQRELQRKNQELIRQNRRLQRELEKKEKALSEAATLLMLSKKARSAVATGRGTMIPPEDRSQLMELFREGLKEGASATAIADLIGICSRTLRRWGIAFQTHGFSQDRRKGSPRNVAHRFTPEERQRLIHIVNDPRFADLTPAQIVAILAEERIYVGSESTIYRIMRQEGLLNHRGRTRLPREPREVPVLEATGIHQVLAWDITLLPGPVKGQFYYLYMVMDVWSRRILGAEVHEHECSELASAFFDRVCRDEGISKETAAVLHSDNGAPMRSFTLAAKMAELGVSLSFSRPRVSNDNAYAESWFRTMKYHQSYPLRRFRDLLSVKAWVDGFVEWYNAEHRHSGIKYVTPNQRHYGQADAICAIRQQTYEEARQRHPQRWSRPPRNWLQPQVVSINHPRPQKPVAA